MKSSVSPITSAGASAAGNARALGETDAAAFEALLIPVLLKPIVDALGPLGATFGDTVARAVLAQSSESRER